MSFMRVFGALEKWAFCRTQLLTGRCIGTSSCSRLSSSLSILESNSTALDRNPNYKTLGTPTISAAPNIHKSTYLKSQVSTGDDRKGDLDYWKEGIFRETRELHYALNVLVPAFEAVASDPTSKTIDELLCKMLHFRKDVVVGHRRFMLSKDVRKIVGRPYLNAFAAIARLLQQEKESTTAAESESTKGPIEGFSGDGGAHAVVSGEEGAAEDRGSDSTGFKASNTELHESDEALHLVPWISARMLVEYCQFGSVFGFQAWNLFWAEHAAEFLKLFTSALLLRSGQLVSGDVSRIWTYLVKLNYGPDRNFIGELATVSARQLLDKTDSYLQSKSEDKVGERVSYFPYAITMCFRGLALLGNQMMFREHLAQFCVAIDKLAQNFGEVEYYNCLSALLIMDCYWVKAEPEFLDRILDCAIALLEALDTTAPDRKQAALEVDADDYAPGPQQHTPLTRVTSTKKDRLVFATTLYQALKYYNRRPDVAEKLLAILKSNDNALVSSTSLAERKITKILVELADSLKISVKSDVWMDCIARRVDFLLEPKSRRMERKLYIVCYDGPSNYNHPDPMYKLRRDHEYVKRITDKLGIKTYRIPYFEWTEAQTDLERYRLLRNGFKRELGLVSSAAKLRIA